MNIRDRIKVESKDYPLYNVRIDKYKQDGMEIPFRVSEQPFTLTKPQRQELGEIGHVICDYMDSVIELYNSSDEVRETLNKGKPDIYLNGQAPQYLFLRPDLILTREGFSVCEIETSPFGLALAEILNNAYGQENFDTVINQNTLKNYISSQAPEQGTIAYSDKTAAFSGQIQFLAEQIFSEGGKKWDSSIIDGKNIDSKEIYRAFYLSEYLNDENVARLLEESKTFLPTLTPQFEEKAILSFIWDSRFVDFFKSKLGEADFKHLRRIIPPTWILGQEANFDLGMPRGITNSLSIADLEKGKRKFVLKQSGFSNSSSWAEGVAFLHKLSHKGAREKLEAASKDSSHMYILQDFKEGKHQKMEYTETDGTIKKMDAKIRITPYYSFSGRSKGELLAAKVTGCEDTDYIHATTASINTAVAMGRGEER